MVSEHTGVCAYDARHTETMSVSFVFAVDCPAGTSYSIEDKACLPCPIGSYQDSEGQMQCKTCKTNYITESEGAFDVSLCSKCKYGLKMYGPIFHEVLCFA